MIQCIIRAEYVHHYDSHHLSRHEHIVSHFHLSEPLWLARDRMNNFRTQTKQEKKRQHHPTYATQGNLADLTVSAVSSCLSGPREPGTDEVQKRVQRRDGLANTGAQFTEKVRRGKLSRIRRKCCTLACYQRVENFCPRFLMDNFYYSTVKSEFFHGCVFSFDECKTKLGEDAVKIVPLSKS